jgi:hypothetical protein
VEINPLKVYHQKKLKEAIDYLYPKNIGYRSKEREKLLRVTNRETQIGSFIDCGSDILCGTIDPMVSYELDSLLIALKGGLNFVDDGLSNSKVCDVGYGHKRVWCANYNEESK